MRSAGGNTVLQFVCEEERLCKVFGSGVQHPDVLFRHRSLELSQLTISKLTVEIIREKWFEAFGEMRRGMFQRKLAHMRTPI